MSDVSLEEDGEKPALRSTEKIVVVHSSVLHLNYDSWQTESTRCKRMAHYAVPGRDIVGNSVRNERVIRS